MHRVDCSLCSLSAYSPYFTFFFFNDTATTEIYTLSLHDALPISSPSSGGSGNASPSRPQGLERPLRSGRFCLGLRRPDRKSTRLNSSHSQISYAVFCLKKKKISPDTSFMIATLRPQPSARRTVQL